MLSITDWIHKRGRARQFLPPVLLAVAGLAAALIFLGTRLEAWLRPQATVTRYVASVYARDYGRAYAFLSSADKAVKGRAEYVRENGAFSGFTLEAARRLASYIEFREIRVEWQGDRATATVTLVVPDGNADVAREVLFADPLTSEPWPDNLPEARKRALLARLDQLRESGQLPTLEGEQTLTLVRERGGWRIFENWDEAVVVHFSGTVKDGLPWAFGPAQEEIRALPGQTVRTFYRAKNLSDKTVAAKACHHVEPEEQEAYLETILCFCLIQDSLAPGEEKEMPVVFRVRPDAPPSVTRFDVRYEFYPIETFPEDCEEPG